MNETLHSLERPDWRQPLFVLVAIDTPGHLLNVAACDPEDYE